MLYKIRYNIDGNIEIFEKKSQIFASTVLQLQRCHLLRSTAFKIVL